MLSKSLDASSPLAPWLLFQCPFLKCLVPQGFVLRPLLSLSNSAGEISSSPGVSVTIRWLMTLKALSPVQKTSLNP